jgi:phosphoribosyl 1,2-cyclic phosphodiesterase
VLGSGSKGNAVLLQCGDTRVLIDAGFSPRMLGRRLVAVGVPPASIQACVVTHDHIDHVRGAAKAATRWGWALHATAGTARSCPDLLDADARTFEPGATLALGRLELRSVPTSHDAEEPVALVATSVATGARTGICYDLGFVTDGIRGAFRDLDLLVLESNHDEGMLRAGPYPRSLQNRIAGRQGHLSNRAAAAMAQACVSRSLRQVVLAHLSEINNHPTVAARTMESALGRTRFRGRVAVAGQHAPTGPFEPASGRGVQEAQLALAL